MVMESILKEPRFHRAPSLSLVTVTSLEKKKNPFFNLSDRFRSDALGFIHTNNFDNFYEKATIETPTIVVDKGSDPDLSHNRIVEENMSDISSNHSVNNLKYLTPPSHRTLRRVSSETGSISSMGSITSRRLKKSSDMNNNSNHSRRDDDNMSIGRCSIVHTNDMSVNQSDVGQMDIRLANFVSVMYALIVIMVGAIICIKDIEQTVHYANGIWTILTNLIGFGWLIFLHRDIQEYKKWALEYLKPENDSKGSENTQNNLFDDGLSISTAIIFNSIKRKAVPDDSNASSISPFESAYRFIHGKHSGNFYLKCGITIFCFGSIVHMGIQTFARVYYFIAHDEECYDVIIIFVLLIRSIYSFYQLFMAFKYQNILINRHRTIARFALMHMVGTAISLWFNTILNEAVEDYVHKMSERNITVVNSTDDYEDIEVPNDALFVDAIEHQKHCLEKSIVSLESNALPYLYPFTIEFNIVMASIWYIIWTNIGKDHHNAHIHHMRKEVSENEVGEEVVEYHSSLAINADCHASNRGLFGGLIILLFTFITIIIFYTTIQHKQFSQIGISIYSAQIGSITALCCIAIVLAYRQMRSLDIVSFHHLDNPSTSMDDILVLMPVPIYILHYVLSIVAIASDHHEETINRYFLICIYVLTMIQVLIQSPFLVDGIRRCSNAKTMRFKKPGRELITFALILNITLWILNTFELKSVEKHHGMPEYYGKMVWMIISHTTTPIMLFYRYHSSICLSDIWKYAYEKDEQGAPNL